LRAARCSEALRRFCTTVIRRLLFVVLLAIVENSTVSSENRGSNRAGRANDGHFVREHSGRPIGDVVELGRDRRFVRHQTAVMAVILNSQKFHSRG
jgi:hypothetical protein